MKWGEIGKAWRKNKKIKYIFNKYILVGGVFLIWMFFFDQNSFLMHRSLDEDIEQLREDQAYYKEQIRLEKKQLHQLKTQPQALEEIAREKYWMKKQGEDLFLIQEKKDTAQTIAD